MTVDKRNNILSVIGAVIIVLLGWWLVRSIVLPYQQVEARMAMTDYVHMRMLNISDALIQYEQQFGHFPPSEGGLDSLMAWVRADTSQVISDSLFYTEEYGVVEDSILYSPRPPHQKFIYAKTDSLIREIYVLKDPSPEYDAQIGSLTNTTLINTPNW